jgi:hypothetical protein
MRLLSPIIRVPIVVMGNIWHQLTMCNRIAPQFISKDFPGLSAMRLEQAPEEPLGRSAIPSGLEKYINYFAILVNSPPQIMLLAVDLDEDLIDKERITIAPVFSFQSTGVHSSELYAPQTNRFAADSNAPFC